MEAQEQAVHSERRIDMNQFKDSVQNQLDEMRKTINAFHGETQSSRESVNANSRYMLEMTGQFTESFTQLRDLMRENTAISADARDKATEALLIAKQTKADTEGLVNLYNAGKKTADAVQRGTVKAWLFTKIATLRASKLSKVLIPCVVLWGLVMAYWHGETLHIKDILEAIK